MVQCTMILCSFTGFQKNQERTWIFVHWGYYSIQLGHLYEIKVGIKGKIGLNEGWNTPSPSCWRPAAGWTPGPGRQTVWGGCGRPQSSAGLPESNRQILEKCNQCLVKPRGWHHFTRCLVSSRFNQQTLRKLYILNTAFWWFQSVKYRNCNKLLKRASWKYLAKKIALF